MKKITEQQIEALLQTIYQTNIPASQFDIVRKMLSELPKIEEEEQKK